MEGVEWAVNITIGIGTSELEYCRAGVIRLSSKYSMGKWEFLAKEQKGNSAWKILRGNIKAKASVLAKETWQDSFSRQFRMIRYHLAGWWW